MGELKLIIGNIRSRVSVFKAMRNVDYVFHGGDITTPMMAKKFTEVEDAKFISVFGNCDDSRDLLQSTIENHGGEVFGETYVGDIGGRKIFMTHDPIMLEDVIDKGDFDLVIYGHTHCQDIRRVGKTLVVNPGALDDKASVVIVDIDDMAIETISLDPEPTISRE